MSSQRGTIKRKLRKHPYDMEFSTLVNYFYGTSMSTLNWVFPIDTKPFCLTKAERLGFKLPAQTAQLSSEFGMDPDPSA